MYDSLSSPIPPNLPCLQLSPSLVETISSNQFLKQDNVWVTFVFSLFSHTLSCSFYFQKIFKMDQSSFPLFCLAWPWTHHPDNLTLCIFSCIFTNHLFSTLFQGLKGQSNDRPVKRLSCTQTNQVWSPPSHMAQLRPLHFISIKSQELHSSTPWKLLVSSPFHLSLQSFWLPWSP